MRFDEGAQVLLARGEPRGDALQHLELAVAPRLVASLQHGDRAVDPRQHAVAQQRRFLDRRLQGGQRLRDFGGRADLRRALLVRGLRAARARFGDRTLVAVPQRDRNRRPDDERDVLGTGEIAGAGEDRDVGNASAAGLGDRSLVAFELRCPAREVRTLAGAPLQLCERRWRRKSGEVSLGALEARLDAKLRAACTVETRLRYGLGREIVDQECVAEARTAALAEADRIVAADLRAGRSVAAN